MAGLSFRTAWAGAACTLALALSSPAFAQANIPLETPASASREALARQLLQAMNFQAQIGRAISLVEPVIDSMMRGHPEIPSNLREPLKQLFLEEFTRLSPRMEQETAAMYARTFSEEDLRALVAFYASPVGKKYLEKQPELMAAGAAVGRRLGAEAAARAAERLCKMNDCTGAGTSRSARPSR